jgi:hypothetical protein
MRWFLPCIHRDLEQQKMNWPASLTTVLILAILGAAQTAPDRNRIEGVVVERLGSDAPPLVGIRVYLLDLNDQQQNNSATTDKDGKFSIIVPVTLGAFRLLFEDDSLQHWDVKNEFSNSSHPHDIGQQVLHGTNQRLTLAQAEEQRHLATLLEQIDPERGKIRLSQVATDYPQIFNGGCTASAPVFMESRVVTAQAIPDLLKSRMAANEGSAEAAVRTINTAQITYSTLYPEIGYADRLEKLGLSGDGTPTQSHAGLIDEGLASGRKFGYAFGLSVQDENNVS